MRNKALLRGAALVVMLGLSAVWADSALAQRSGGGQGGRSGGQGGGGRGGSHFTRDQLLKRDDECRRPPCERPGKRVILVPGFMVDLLTGFGDGRPGDNPAVIPTDRTPAVQNSSRRTTGQATSRRTSSGPSPRRVPSVAEILAGLPASRIPIPQPRPDGAGPSLPDIAPGPTPRPTPPLPGPSRAIVGEFVSDEVLVTLEGDAAVAAEVAAAFGLEVRSARTSTLLGATIARFGIPDGRPVGTALAQLSAEPRISRSDANHVYSLQTSHTPAQYVFQRIAFDAGTADGAGVRVAVIDTAVDSTHPALQGVIVDSFDAMPDRPVEKTDHGTSIVGLLAGVGPLKGMAPGSAVYHARAFENDRSNMGILLDALDWAAESNVRIINMSFAGPRNDLFEAACRSARERGIVLVAAAGNNGPTAPFAFPGAYDGVVAVTATDKDDKLMPEANRGPYVYVSAPGVDVIAPVAGGADFVTGTSIAAAIVSGAIANLLREDQERSPAWIEDALATTALDLGPAGKDGDFGYGLLNMKAVGLMAAQ